jgi:hypothetical protein
MKIKKILLLALVIMIALPGISQKRPDVPAKFRNYTLEMKQPAMEAENVSNNLFQLNQSDLPKADVMGNTYYDLQSNAGMQSRLHVFDDHTMGVVFTYSITYPYFPERGTGYNYFDGTAWGSYPTERIESDRAGWPAYAPFGENGEIFVSHASGGQYSGLFIEKRYNKGMGDWTEMIFQGPYGAPGLFFPRVATAGPDHSIIYLIAVTMPGTPYQGLDGALLYSRSWDGGLTWYPENHLFNFLSYGIYTGFNPDTYEIVAKDNIVAFLYGSPWQDLGLVISSDTGHTFTKTIIWEHPYPMWSGTPTDTFYCVDGAHHLAIDSDGMVHLVFGINRTYADTAGSYWFPFVDGIGYWNENRPTFSNSLNALNPYGEPGSELVEDYSLIGWAQDVNTNGIWDILGEPGKYYLGASSQPQIAVNEYNEILVIFSGITETYNNGTQDYRHLWARSSPNGDWWGSFHDLNSNFAHIYDECVFPSLASDWDYESILVAFQADNEPGMAVCGDYDPYTENLIQFPEDGVGIIELPLPAFEVMQNIPNPAHDLTAINILVRNPVQVILNVTDLIGQVVFEADEGLLPPGLNKIMIDVGHLPDGIYFYTLKTDNSSVSRKMIIRK